MGAGKIEHHHTGMLHFHALLPERDNPVALQPDEVKTIAHLARIGLEESEIGPLSKQLSTVLDLVAELSAIDTSHVEPMAHPANTELRLRDDVVTESDQRDVLQAPAPAIEDGYFLVPRVIE